MERAELTAIKIDMSPKQITLFFATATFTFTLLHIISQVILASKGRDMEYLWLVELLNLDRERSIPTLYAFSALQFSAFLLGLIAYTKHQLSQPYSFHWGLLSAIFLFLALDEGTAIHENLITPSVSWVTPYLILLSFFLLGLIPFIKHLPSQTRRLFIISGMVFVGGAAGVEVIGGQYLHNYGGDAPYLILVTIEEFMEMLGIVIFIYALLVYIERHLPPIRFESRSQVAELA